MFRRNSNKVRYELTTNGTNIFRTTDRAKAIERYIQRKNAEPQQSHLLIGYVR